MTGLAGIVVGIVLTAAIFGLVRLSRDGHLKRRALIGLAVVCAALFNLLNVSDWPSGILAAFWRDHSMVAATAGTLLLVGVGYFAFEAQDHSRQDEADKQIAGAGRAGVVDHLIEIDVTLALAMGSLKELEDLWPDWNQAGRPLRWLRASRHLLYTRAGLAVGRDPRAWLPPTSLDAEPWRQILVDQAVRRIMGGIRDWCVVFGRSRAGQSDLINLGKLRLELLDIEEGLRKGGTGETVTRMVKCQGTVRVLANTFETQSGAKPRIELHSVQAVGR